MLPFSPSCTVASPRECNYATGPKSATSNATAKVSKSGKPLSLRELRLQLRAQPACNASDIGEIKTATELHTSNIATDGVSTGWRFRFIDREPLDCYYTPPIGYAEALEWRPDAVAAEPIRNQEKRQATPEEANELRQLLALVCADYPPNELVEALALALADADDALRCYRSLASRRAA